MAVSIVKSANVDGSGGAAVTHTATLTGSTTTGNGLVVVALNLFTSGGDNFAVSDNASSTFTSKEHPVSGSPAQFSCQIWVAENITGTASHAVTITNNSGFYNIWVYEVTGVATSAITGNHAANTGSGTTFDATAAGAGISTTTGSMMFTAVVNNQTQAVTPAAGWTSDDTTTALNLQHKAATGANMDQTWTVSTGAGFYAFILEILAGGGGGGGTAWHDRAFPRGAQRGVAR